MYPFRNKNKKILVKDWYDFYDNEVNGGKTIVLIFSYFSFFFKVYLLSYNPLNFNKLFYWILFWKCSVRSQNPDYNFERDFRAKYEHHRK